MNPNDEENWTVVAKKTKKAKMSIDGKKTPPNERTEKTIKPSIIKETMVIEPEMMGLVAGRKGCNLERLKKIYGVKFILPPKGGSQAHHRRTGQNGFRR